VDSQFILLMGGQEGLLLAALMAAEGELLYLFGPEARLRVAGGEAESRSDAA
jgi:hypothetical protein